jgi:predicted NAD/FAD-binding protein
VRIGVVGTGIAGSAAAWLLARAHDVTLIDGAARAGGHTDTLMLPRAGAAPVPVDTGFIVFNPTTYPLFVRLLEELDVASVDSDMSWGLRCDHCDLEYGGDLRGVLAQPTRLLDPTYLRMLRDIARFNRKGREAIGTAADRSALTGSAGSTRGAGMLVDDAGADLGITAFLDHHRLGDGFRRHYLLPMAAAIWSSGTATVEEFPARSLLAFFANHGLLGVRSHLAWRTVQGGAVRYLERLLEPLRGRIRLGSPVRSISRASGRATVVTEDGQQDDFDAVVIATRPDDALRFLADPSDEERELLGAWRSSDNERVVHTDASLLPRSPAARASWSYHASDCRSSSQHASLSYLMNRLQGIDGPEQVLVTINPVRQPRPETVIRRDRVTHPILDARALATQPALDRLNGVRGTYYAGAWQRWGFHEDGLWSAVRAVRHLGVAWP